MKRLGVCFALAYRAPDYIRGRSLQQALASLPGVELHRAVNDDPGWRRYAQTLGQLRRIRREQDPAIYLLGFRGHEIFWPVRWLTRNRTLLFDSLMSPSTALLEENKHGAPGRWLSHPLSWLEGRILRAADGVLTDTQAHRQLLIQRFGLDERRVYVLPVGADETPLPHPPRQPDAPLQVLFYGSFLPLHGIPVLEQALTMLRDRPLAFLFIGGGDTGKQFAARCRQMDLTKVRHLPWVPFPQLLKQYLPTCDLCLGGPFGGTPQARRVITGKTSQALALGIPTLVGEIPESTDWGFQDRANCLLVAQDNSHAVAEALCWASDHREQLPLIGQAGRDLYQQRLSVACIRQQLASVIDHDSLLSTTSAISSF